ncbi:hypothetical protein GCM10023165_13010 [Variovorax defluvii]|uniref:Tir chaperone family protein CesT n=1 Tax=Variovorax defluvii TaxID=913761 RepID=A0ABP8H923_9BURK
MSREDYVELVQDLCEELELGDAGEFLERSLLQVDDTLVGLEYLEERDEIRLLADLGEIEEGVDRSAMLQLLLEFNLGNTSFYLPTFSLHAENHHPVLAYHIPLQALLDDDVELSFVLQEQLLPVLDEWKARLRDALASAPPAADPLPQFGSMA